LGALEEKVKALVSGIQAVQTNDGVNSTKQAPAAHVAIADVVRFGEKLVLPENMKIDDAISMLQRQKKYDEEVVVLTREVPCFPWDGALAMTNAMKHLFGWVNAEPIPTMFGELPPKIIQVEVGYARKQGVPWGQFSLPGVNGVVSTGYAMNGNPQMVQFKMTAKVRRLDSAAVTKLFDLTEQYVQESSIYRGQAIKIRFTNQDGEPCDLPMPQFLDLSQVKTNELVYSKDIQASVETNLFTLLDHTEACRRAGIPLKRGILFEGPYGVGKSLAARCTAKKATDNGWTYLYCERADELDRMVKFAHQYQPAVIFCEDIDRVVAGERSTRMDDVLNIIDGIESKGTEIVIVLTTNFVGRINKAMLRPGRLDAIISIRPPDAEAVQRLIMQYSRGQLAIQNEADMETLCAVGQKLAGKVPAVIRECVERAKLSALKLSGGQDTVITPAALLDSAISMDGQFRIMTATETQRMIVETREDVIRNLGESLVRGLLPTANELLEEARAGAGEDAGTND